MFEPWQEVYMSNPTEALLDELEADLPRLQQDMDAFHQVFEGRSCKVLALEDSPRVEARLMEMLRVAGIA